MLTKIACACCVLILLCSGCSKEPPTAIPEQDTPAASVRDSTSRDDSTGIVPLKQIYVELDAVLLNDSLAQLDITITARPGANQVALDCKGDSTIDTLLSYDILQPMRAETKTAYHLYSPGIYYPCAFVSGRPEIHDMDTLVVHDEVPFVTNPPIQVGFEDSLSSFGPLHLPDYVQDNTPSDSLLYEIAEITGPITAAIDEERNLILTSLIPNANGAARIRVRITDRTQNIVFLDVEYYITNVLDITSPPLQVGLEDSLSSFSPLHLPDYLLEDSLECEILNTAGPITAEIDGDTNLVLTSLVPNANGPASVTVRVTDPVGNHADMIVNYEIAPMTDLSFIVLDFDRQTVPTSTIRIGDTDYPTESGFVHLQVLPTDNVVVQAWRSTPSQWYGISSYIRTRIFPAQTDRTLDIMQVQTFDVCDNIQVTPEEYKDFIREARAVEFWENGCFVYRLGGINPETMNLDTLWYGKIHPITGDTTYDWQQDSLQNEAQRLKDTQLFADSPYPHYYKATFDDTEPFIAGYGPSRQHLHLWYRIVGDCAISIYRDIPNNANTIRSDTEIGSLSGGLPPGCIRGELETALACANGAVFAPAMANKTVIHESWPTEDYTLADKQL
ncbi:MAG: hypothetical protein FJY66_00825, partial [Calditrichaeota bacterium]|nr:hypothetical protein [Calditrichota bacterium]